MIPLGNVLRDFAVLLWERQRDQSRETISWVFKRNTTTASSDLAPNDKIFQYCPNPISLMSLQMISGIIILQITHLCTQMFLLMQMCFCLFSCEPQKVLRKALRTGMGNEKNIQKEKAAHVKPNIEYRLLYLRLMRRTECYKSHIIPTGLIWIIYDTEWHEVRKEMERSSVRATHAGEVMSCQSSTKNSYSKSAVMATKNWNIIQIKLTVADYTIQKFEVSKMGFFKEINSLGCI